MEIYILNMDVFQYSLPDYSASVRVTVKCIPVMNIKTSYTSLKSVRDLPLPYLWSANTVGVHCPPACHDGARPNGFRFRGGQAHRRDVRHHGGGPVKLEQRHVVPVSLRRELVLRVHDDITEIEHIYVQGTIVYFNVLPLCTEDQLL